MIIKTFEHFMAITEAAINAGPESEVVVNDMITTNGTEISSEEILGLVVSSDNEKALEDRLRSKYDKLTFSKEDISTIIKYWNEYSAEIKEKELEAEKEEEGGDEEDPMAGI